MRLGGIARSVSDLDRARQLGAQESGLAVAITTRGDGLPRASVVNAGVLEDPMTRGQVVGFVSRGAALKLADLRARPRATVVFRSGWEWVAVEGDARVIGPDDPFEGFSQDAVMSLVRTVYSAALGGTPDEWSRLDETMATERHTVVLISPRRIYPADV